MGFHFAGGCKTDKLTVDAKLSNDIEEVWIPLRRALDSILCYGFVV